MQHRQSNFSPEVMLAEISTCRNKVSPTNAEPMFRCMWPRNLVGRHDWQGDNFGLRWQAKRDTALSSGLENRMRDAIRKRRRRWHSAGAVHNDIHPSNATSNASDTLCLSVLDLTILDCGGKRSATPLYKVDCIIDRMRHAIRKRRRRWHSAGAVQIFNR